MTINVTDVRDLINNPEGRTPYPEDSKMMLTSGGTTPQTTQNLVVEVKQLDPKWNYINTAGEGTRPHDTPTSKNDSPTIDLAPYLVSDKAGTYDNAILKITYTVMPFAFWFIPDGSDKAETVNSPAFEFEIDPSKLEGVSTLYSPDGLFRADLHYYLLDDDVSFGVYLKDGQHLGRSIVVESLIITYDAKTVDSNKKVTGHIGFQANVSLMPPQIGTNHTDFPYKLVYMSYTGCSKDSVHPVPTVEVINYDGNPPKAFNKFYITTLKLESEN